MTKDEDDGPIVLPVWICKNKECKKMNPDSASFCEGCGWPRL